MMYQSNATHLHQRGNSKRVFGQKSFVPDYSGRPFYSKSTEEAAGRMEKDVQEVTPGVIKEAIPDLVDQLAQVTIYTLKLKFDPSIKVKFSSDDQHIYVTASAPDIRLQFVE